MSALDVRVAIDTLRSINSATFTGAYQALGTPLAFSARMIKITNNCNVLVLVSDDGVNAKEVVPANSFLLLDFSANREVGNQWEKAVNTQFYVLGAAGIGLVYLSVYYAN